MRATNSMEVLLYLSLSAMIALWVAIYLCSRARMRVTNHLLFLAGTLIASPALALALTGLMMDAVYRDIDDPVISVVPVFVIGITVPSAFVIWFIGYGAAKVLSFFMQRRATL